MSIKDPVSGSRIGQAVIEIDRQVRTFNLCRYNSENDLFLLYAERIKLGDGYIVCAVPLH